MAYEIGTAQNERDLLQKIDLFLTTNSDLVAAGEEWKQIYTKTDPGTAVKTESLSYVWSAPGSTTEDEIFIGCQSYGSITNDVYNLMFAGGTYFNPVVASPDIFAGLVNNSEKVGVSSDGRSFGYWVFANGRRVIVITSISGSVYSSLYCGFMLPNATPLEYPYPLVISGSINSETLRYSDVSSANASILDPRSKHMWLLRPDLGWYDFYGSSVSGATSAGATRYVMPMGNNRFTGKTFNLISGMAGAPGDHYPLIPIELSSIEAQGVNFWGTLDAACWVPGMSRASEDIIETADNRRFILFQDAFRTTTTSFFAVEMV